jgi:ABC-type glycerol-3-phosphate transport system substrate-binding protein
MLAAAGCAKATTPESGGGAAGEIDEKAPVTITIGDRPTPDKPNDIKAFEQKIKDFTAKYPNITVKSTETKWEAQTFPT